MEDKIFKTGRLSSREKNANKKYWYKSNADRLDIEHFYLNEENNGFSEYKRMKVNFDLFNNILNISDFEYVCKPFGSNVGELPAKMINRDISSGKIKALIGMEMKRSSSWNVVATNSEATTRKEQEEFKRIKDYVIGEILTPIRTEIEIRKQQELQGKKLNNEEKQKILQEIEEELKAKTPEEVKKYMEREHQDPAEVMAKQLLEYLTQKCDLEVKFNEAFKYGLLSAKEIMYVGILNGEPEVWNVNSLRFNYEKSPDLKFIEDSESATCEYRMSPSEVIKYFGDQLTPKQIDDIYKNYDRTNNEKLYDWIDSENTNMFDSNEHNSVRVLHCVWKGLRKIGFLSYIDENGDEQELIVDENYKLNKDQLDVSIEWEWLPEAYETWKIMSDIYVNMRPIPGQFKDIDNLYHCKLPYYGVVHDNMNSQETALMDRLKVYQYYYNIVMYRLELLLASDKGKKVLMNINAIPDSAGIDIKQWQYFMESTPYMWYDPNEEAKSYADANTVAKVIDLSLVSDIQKYMEIAEYLRQQSGKSVGITDQVEGQIGPYEKASNTKQSLIQSSHILEPYFNLHSHLKKNILGALLETAKIAYHNSNKKKLTYILDDMSVKIINLDIGLLDNSTFGIFMSNSSKIEEVKESIRQLTHAALQNQKVELSDVMSVMRQDGIAEAEETLKVAENRRREYEQNIQQQQSKSQQEMQQKEIERDKEKHEEEKEIIILKEEERRKTELLKASIMGASFNPDLDKDNNGENDFIEIAKHGLDTEVKRQKGQLDREKFEYQKKIDEKRIENEKEKIKIQKEKTNNTKK